MFQVELVSRPRGINEFTFRKLSFSGEVIQPATLPPPSPDKFETCPECGQTFVLNDKNRSSNVYRHIRTDHPELSETRREELVASEKASKLERNRRKKNEMKISKLASNKSKNLRGSTRYLVWSFRIPSYLTFSALTLSHVAPGSGSGSSSNKIRIPGGRMPKNVPNPESGSSGNIPVPGGMHHSPTK